MFLKQSTAVTIVLGPFVDSTDGVTAETGLTISQADVRLSKNAGAFAQKNDSNAASHMENGYYSAALNTTDTNTLGQLFVAVNESGALPVWRHFLVLPANIYDSFVSGTDLIDISLVQIAGSAVSTSTAQLGVNAVQAGGTAWGSGAITAGAIAADAITAAKVAADVSNEIADQVWDEAISGHLTAGSTGRILSDVPTASAATIADAVWDEATSGHTTGGSTGKALTDANNGTPPTANAIADQVWDEALSGHLTAGSTGDALNDAGGAATDPWATSLPGPYTSGQAGWIVGNRLDAAVSSVSGNDPGAGANEWTYTLTEEGSGDPIADADVWVSTDSAGSNVVASGRTNQDGEIIFYLDSGTVYVWRQKSGWNFSNPDTEIVP